MGIVDDNRSFYVAMVENKLSGMITDIVYEIVSFVILEWLNQENPAENSGSRS